MIGCDRKIALVAGGYTDKRFLAQFGLILVVDRRAVVRTVVAAERTVDYQRFAIGFGIIDKSFYGEKDVGVGA